MCEFHRSFQFIHTVICFHQNILDMLQFQKKFKNIYLDIYVIREEACMQMSVDHVLDPE